MNIKRYLQFRKYPSFIKRNANLFFEYVTGTIRFQKKMPQFRFWNFAKLAKQKRRELEPYYNEYTTRVSHDCITISLELSVFILILCEILKPRSILDLGSGFSSFVFRYYAKNANLKPVIWSVDDNPEWLEKTRLFLDDHGLSTENLATWDSFHNPGDFDLTLHDLGNITLRMATFREVLNSVNPRGVVVLDDIQKYGWFVRPSLKELGRKSYNLRYFTKDKIKRYSFLVCPAE